MNRALCAVRSSSFLKCVGVCKPVHSEQQQHYGQRDAGGEQRLNCRTGHSDVGVNEWFKKKYILCFFWGNVIDRTEKIGECVWGGRGGGAQGMTSGRARTWVLAELVGAGPVWDVGCWCCHCATASPERERYCKGGREREMKRKGKMKGLTVG